MLTTQSISGRQTNKVENFIKEIKLIMDLTAKENAAAMEVYLSLKSHLRDTQSRFPLYENIIAIYFPDLMKFFSGIFLRSGEIRRQTAWPTHPHVQDNKTRKWPYLLYYELANGFDISQFEWGHRFQTGWQFDLKRCASQLFFYKKQKLSLSFTQSAASRTMISLAIKNKLKFNIVALDSASKTPIPNLEEQLLSLKEMFQQICNIIHHAESWRLFHEIFSNHIRANCEEGCSHNQKIGDILIAGSGVEIENRLLSSLARRNQSQVINILHGGTYWIHDKPALKEGEKLLCTDYFAYGAVQCQEPDLNRNLFQGSFDKTSHIIDKSEINSISKSCRFMYVPTSLNGISKRHGPFESMADSFYSYIQEYTACLFGASLIIKAHPKDNLEVKLLTNLKAKNFEDCLDLADAFVFDYHGTAFNIAAATNKPIIFFDYGIQNFTTKALAAIKSRTAYFDMQYQMPKTFEELMRKSCKIKFDNAFTHNFSSKPGQPLLTEILFQEIKKRVNVGQ